MAENKYDLSFENHVEADGVVFHIEVSYDIVKDDVVVAFGRRTDVVNEDLLLRLAEQVERALRQISKQYDTDVSFIEMLAGVGEETVAESAKKKAVKPESGIKRKRNCSCHDDKGQYVKNSKPGWHHG